MRVNKRAVLAPLAFAHRIFNGGWYCRDYNREKYGKKAIFIGPFNSEADALAYWQLQNPSRSIRDYAGIYLYDDNEIAAIQEDPQAHIDHETVEFVSPFDASLTCKGWTTPHSAERTERFLTEAKKYLGVC